MEPISPEAAAEMLAGSVLGRALAAMADEHRWMRDARCTDADPGAFFPERGMQPDAARRICASCPVREPCLDYALELEVDEDSEQYVFGVFAGLTGRERQRLGRADAA